MSILSNNRFHQPEQTPPPSRSLQGRWVHRQKCYSTKNSAQFVQEEILFSPKSQSKLIISSWSFGNCSTFLSLLFPFRLFLRSLHMYILKQLFCLRWLNRVFLRLSSARYHCLPNVSINHAFTNDASNPKKKRNHFSAWKALNHFNIRSNSFNLYSNMCLSLGPKNMTKKSINNR